MSKVYAAKCPACDSNFSILEGEEVKCRVCGYDKIETYPLESFEDARLREDLAIAKDPKKWPMRPLLPMKKPRDRGFPRMGCLIEGQGPIVFICDICEIGPKTDFSKIEKFVFGDYEALFKDGWQID